MARHLHRLGTLTIASGQTDSPTLLDKVAFGTLVDLLVYSPATLPETINPQVAPNDSPAAGDWKTLQVTPGTDVVIAAAKAVVIAAAGYKAFRLHAGVAVAADRTFELMAQLDSTVGVI